MLALRTITDRSCSNRDERCRRSSDDCSHRRGQQRRCRRSGAGGCVAVVPFAQTHLGRDVPRRVGHVETAGPVDAGRPGTAAHRQPARGHVHAPRRQAGRTVEYVRPALRVASVRPERAAVLAPVLVARQAAVLLPRIDHRPAAAAAAFARSSRRHGGHDQEERRRCHHVAR